MPAPLYDALEEATMTANLGSGSPTTIIGREHQCA
jgi:hypothetical protein